MIRYLNIFFLSLLFILTIVVFFHTDSAITQDLGRHLVLGRIIWEEKHIPETNLFSYTYPDFPFINHHWGSEVIFYLVNKLLFLSGLIITKVIIIILAFGTLILFVNKRSDFFSLLFSSTLSLEILRERTEIRPEIFALLFFSLFLIILYREKEKEKKFIWALPLLELLWVNIHISFCLGIVVYFLFFADRLLAKKVKIKHLVVGLVLIVSTLINPSGLSGAIYPLFIFNNYGYSIVENQSPLFLEQLMNNPTIFYFKVAVFSLLFVSPLLLTKRYFFEISVTLLFALLSFFAIRHFPFFALSLVLPLSVGFTVLRQRTVLLKRILKENVFWIRLIIPLLLLGFLTNEIYTLTSNKYYKRRNLSLRTGLGQVKGTKETVDFLLKNNLKGPIFNNFDIGSYLIYRLYPKEQVFVDGRPEAYPVSFFQQVYIPMQEKEGVWKKVQRKYNFQTIVFSHTDATPWGRNFVRRILNDQSWAIVYFDDYGLILVRSDSPPESIDLIKSEKELRDYALARIRQANQPDVLIRLANFFRLLRLFDLADMAKLKAGGLL